MTIRPKLLLHGSPSNPPLIQTHLEWIFEKIIEYENLTLRCIEFVFIPPSRIRELNNTYLGHDYVTDILTFNYDNNMPFVEDLSEIQASLICCSEKITQNAQLYRRSCTEEHYRVFIHGLLHLSGYDDKTTHQQAIMKQKECFYLNLMHTHGKSVGGKF